MWSVDKDYKVLLLFTGDAMRFDFQSWVNYLKKNELGNEIGTHRIFREQDCRVS